MTNEEKRRFLLELDFSGNVTFACHASGVDRRTAYETRKAEPMFERLWKRAASNSRKALEERIRRA